MGAKCDVAWPGLAWTSLAWPGACMNRVWRKRGVARHSTALGLGLYKHPSPGQASQVRLTFHTPLCQGTLRRPQYYPPPAQHPLKRFCKSLCSMEKREWERARVLQTAHQSWVAVASSSRGEGRHTGPLRATERPRKDPMCRGGGRCWGWDHRNGGSKSCTL